MSEERELLERALKGLENRRDEVADWGAYADEYFQKKWGYEYSIAEFDGLMEQIRAYLDTPEVNMYAHPNLVIDECIKIIKLGMTRDGHNTPQYKQSIRHIKDLESLKLEGV